MIAAVLGLSIASPALAQEASTSSGGSASDPGGLGSAYGGSFSGVGSGGTCCKGKYDYTNADGNANAVISNFNQKLAAMQLAIIEALRLQAGQDTGGRREQTGAQYNLADQQDDRSTVKSVEEARLRAIMEATNSPSACTIITQTKGATSLGSANQVSAALSTELASWSRSENEISKRGKDFALATRVAAHCKYATQSDVDAGLCGSTGTVTLSDDEASKSLFKRENGGMKYTYKQDTAEAARLFVLNTFSPSPVQALSTAEAKTPEGLMKKAHQSTYLGRGSIAQTVANDAFADRTATITDSATTGALADMASKMQGYAGVSFSEGASKLDWLAIQSRWFMSPSALTKSDTDIASAIKEIKNILAVMAYQNFENYLQMEKMNVNLALSNTILNDNNRIQFEGR
ncbi:hypothetical protein G6L37_04000 [Agrobacterium rubi]|nr:hypothetical protein [Agrobacterium rubi]NTF24513.1 hypothetical protein [Agrobacterium rubi]